MARYLDLARFRHLRYFLRLFLRDARQSAACRGCLPHREDRDEQGWHENGNGFQVPWARFPGYEANESSIISFATLTGTPIAGALLAHDNGGFTDAIIFSAVVMIAGFVFLFSARTARVGMQLRKKA